MELPAILHTTPDREIISTRTVPFPRQLVFRAWTDPDKLQQWWGPKDFTNTFHEFDLRPGGAWRFTMHGPDKGHYPNACTFIVIHEPELLIWDHHPHPKFQAEARFEPVSDTETRIVYTMKFDTAEECAKIKTFAPGKNQENFDRLEKVLAGMV